MVKRRLQESDVDDSAKRRKRLASNPSKDEPAAGILSRIELRNFMNHAYLKFDFQPRVNFITGHNGTGKSALLTGLLVGLGGKATATNRGNSLSGFIQDGKQVSEIKITLRNTGTDAYKPDVYGDSILVERKLFRNGTSDYRIKTGEGRVVSTKKQDLTRILEAFNIQVENPVCILNQEVSKNFLCSKNPTDRFKFFQKATQLEQMVLRYKAAQEDFDKSVRLLKSKESSMQLMENEMKRAQEKAAALESLDKLRVRLGEKQRDLAWSLVNQKEEDYDRMKENLERHQRDRRKYEAKIETAEAAIVEAERKKKEIEERIKLMAEDVGSLKPKRDQLNSQLQEKRKVCRANKDTLMQHKKELRRLENEKKVMSERIEDIQASQKKDNSAQKRQREDKMEKIRHKMNEMDQSMNEMRGQISRLSTTLNELREQKQEIASSLGDNERVKTTHQRRIGELEKARNNKVLRFGKFWPALLEEVEKLHKAGRFKGPKPYGPLGSHITLTDMRYALGAERALGATMTSFLVNTKEDKALLEQVKKRVCGNERGPDILYSQQFIKERYDVRKDRAKTHHPTLDDVLVVDDNVVWNCLVDEASIHNIVMVLDPGQARQLMHYNAPQNGHVCYDSNGDEMRANPFRALANKRDRPSFLSANVEDDIRAEAMKLKQVSKTLSEEKVKMDEIALQIQTNHERQVTLKNTLSSMEKLLRKLGAELEDLNNQAVDEEVTGDVDVLLSDLDSHNNEIVQIHQVLEQASRRYEESQTDEKQLEKDLAAVSAEMRNFNGSLEPLKMELTEAISDFDKAKTDKEHYTAQLKKFDTKVNQEAAAVQKFYEEEVQKSVEIAGKMCERRKPSKKPEVINAALEKLKQRLNEEEQLRGDADEIRKELTDRTEKYYTAKVDLDSCLTFRKVMNESLKIRKKNLTTITHITAQITKEFFTTMLHERNYDGRLDFDFLENKLDIVVKPSSTQSLDSTDLRGLSGGEKSFSTLCFMMSLWHNVSTPFRAMDEFDVFMDMVNRKVSMKMIIQFAGTKPNHQFILLTPQDTSQLDACPYLNIFRMPDPLRSRRQPDDGEQSQA